MARKLPISSPQNEVDFTVTALGSTGVAPAYNADGTSFQPTYALPNAPVASLAAGASVAFASAVTGGSYVFDAQFGGTTPSLQLEALGADETTYRAVGSALTAAGSAGVVVGQNATLRLTNAGANPITGLSASLT